MNDMIEKLEWKGKLSLVQPRIRLLRSFDERSHAYLGYVLGVRGEIAGESDEFLIAIGKASHAKHQFRYHDFVSGASPNRADSGIFYLYNGAQLRILK